MTERKEDEPHAHKSQEPQSYGFFQTMRAVAWGLLGIRKGKGHEEDFSRLNPLHLILAGLMATALFVFLLIAAARWFIGYFT